MGKGKYLYRCPDCGGESWLLGRGGMPTGVADMPSLVDGRLYPSARRVVRLCYWCLMVRWGEKEKVCMGFPTESAAARNSTSSTSTALAPGPLKPFAELWDFLTTGTMPDGSPRLTGRLSLSFESGCLKISLTDDQTRQYCSLAGRNLDDLVAELDLRLGDGTLPWRPSNYAPRVKAKK